MDYNKRGWLIIAAWVAFLIGLYCIITYLAASTLVQDKRAALEQHAARIHPERAEVGKTAPDLKTIKDTKSEKTMLVKSGIYVDRIVKLSVREVGWTVDFYIWFTWTGNDIDPGENFQLIDGEILYKERIKQSAADQERTYALYRVVARITKFFNTTRFPRDDHLLTIKIENETNQYHRLKFEPDYTLSDVSLRVSIPGYRIDKTQIVAKPHSY